MVFVLLVITKTVSFKIGLKQWQRRGWIRLSQNSDCNQIGICACCGIAIDAHLTIQLQSCLAWCGGYVKGIRQYKKVEVQ